MNLYQRLCLHAENQPDRIAIDSEAGQINYKQLKVLTDDCIAYYDDIGLEAGDRVAILALNNPDWFIALFAASHYGVVLVPLNYRLSEKELRYVIGNSEPKLLLHDSEFSGLAKALRDSFGDLRLATIGDDAFPPSAPPVSHSATRIHIAHALLIVFTSGTTGRPKGAVLSQQALLCSAEMSRHMTDLGTDDIVLNVLPLFHVGGLNIQPLPALLYGATLVLHSRFNAEAAVNALLNKNITLVNTVPTILQAMLAEPAWQSDGLPALRAVSIGSTDVPVSLIDSIHEMGTPLIQVYGATETSPVAIYQRIEDASKVGSIGKAGSQCEVRLLNDSNQEVGVGESGEIQVKGENILSYYWRNDAATNASIIDGWFKTGDIAHIDRDGFYWFDDRLKHVIISGGENIYPAELERVIRKVSGVEEVAVVGRADQKWGEVPVAVVVGSADKEAIIRSCELLAKFKRPKDVVIVDALPRNALGKVQAQEVKKLL